MVNNYLTGKCLVSMPHIDDDVFSRSVVYICMHNQEGAMGFMVNKQLKEFYFSDLISQFNIGCTAPVEPIVLHQGGPLERIRGFVLHSLDYRGEGTLPIDDKFAVSSSVNVLNDIAFGKGPRYNLIALGYSSWSRGSWNRKSFTTTGWWWNRRRTCCLRPKTRKSGSGRWTSWALTSTASACIPAVPERALPPLVRGIRIKCRKPRGKWGFFDENETLKFFRPDHAGHSRAPRRFRCSFCRPRPFPAFCAVCR